ncbi:MAG TPA: hypothetical protein DF282_11510 [Hyphomonas sp.]|nr:hypothetical protein [Hyphomonas sp.]HCE23120.1 hypothetical protein [Hyphomonas sp.]HCJ19561.1 hypothetical protein [Hyphomonas sp.]
MNFTGRKKGVIADDHTFSGVSNQTTETLCMHSLSVLDGHRVPDQARGSGPFLLPFVRIRSGRRHILASGHAPKAVSRISFRHVIARANYVLF